MALQPGYSCQTLINLSCQEAKGPGFTTQAGVYLNIILQELAQDYDFATTQGWITGTFGSGIGGAVNTLNVVANSGPYQLPSDFLRCNFGDFFWQFGGINYFPTPEDMADFDAFVQQPGFTTYPTAYAIDTSTSPAGLYLWPAPNGAYPWAMRYQKQPQDISTPSTSTSVPWFPNQMHLKTRLTAEVMALTGDTRRREFLEDAERMLSGYQKKEGNHDTRAVKVHLDPRSFGPRWLSLKGTKAVPW